MGIILQQYIIVFAVKGVNPRFFDRGGAAVLVFATDGVGAFENLESIKVTPSTGMTYLNLNVSHLQLTAFLISLSNNKIRSGLGPMWHSLGFYSALTSPLFLFHHNVFI